MLWTLVGTKKQQNKHHFIQSPRVQLNHCDPVVHGSVYSKICQSRGMFPSRYGYRLSANIAPSNCVFAADSHITRSPEQGQQWMNSGSTSEPLIETVMAGYRGSTGLG
jgi:hypothetical protein